MGREHDFLVGDFVLVGIVFLFLVVFREQLLAALVGGGRNGGFVVAPLNNCDFTVRAWQGCALLSPGFRAKKEQDTFSDFLLGCAAGGRVFSFLMGYQFKKREVVFFTLLPPTSTLDTALLF